MALLQTPIQANQLPKEQSFDALPAGDYAAVIDKTEIKTTKAGDGQYIKLQLKVTQGNHTGRVFWEQINIMNPNPTAVEIGLARLNSILEIGNLTTLQDTDQLIGINLLCSLIVKEDQYGKKNNVKSVKPLNQVLAQQPMAQVQPQQQQINSAWGVQPTPQQPTIQQTQNLLNDEIPF